jgi:hypothetical protein
MQSKVGSNLRKSTNSGTPIGYNIMISCSSWLRWTKTSPKWCSNVNKTLIYKNKNIFISKRASSHATRKVKYHVNQLARPVVGSLALILTLIEMANWAMFPPWSPKHSSAWFWIIKETKKSEELTRRQQKASRLDLICWDSCRRQQRNPNMWVRLRSCISCLRISMKRLPTGVATD